MRGHVSIFQLAPVTQDLQGSLCRARLACRAVTLVAPPDQVGCHPNCLKEAHRREGRGLGVVLSILESQVPGTIVPSRRRIRQVFHRDVSRCAQSRLDGPGDFLAHQDGRQCFCNFATSSLNSAGTSSGGLAGAAAMTSYLGVGGWVFTQIGFQEPRAKLEPKWHMPLWSSISNTVHVSTCVSTLTKCM